MQIMHIANEVVDIGNGICNSAVDLACHQSMKGHNVCFVSTGGGYVDLLERHNVRHFTIEQRPRKLRGVFADLPHLSRVIRDAAPHIVHAHMMTGAILMRLGRALAGLGDFGLVTTVHNEWRFASHLMRLGDRVIVLSDRGMREFKKRGFPEHKLHVVKHGILNSPRRRELPDPEEGPLPSKEHPLTISTVAGLYRRKGIGELIDAFGQVSEEFPEASLLIAGSGPDSDVFERQRRSTKGCDRIRLLGFIKEPRSILSKTSIFVLASYTESFPLALLEAREAGCAIIATAVGGVPELLDHGEAGLLVPPCDPDSIAQALRSLLRDRQELARWRHAACSNLQWMTCERMADETIEVYFSVMAQRSGAGIEAAPDQARIGHSRIFSHETERAVVDVHLQSHL